MKILSYKLFLLAVVFLLGGCAVAQISEADKLPTRTPAAPKKDLSKINLSEIKHIVSKGRAQDGILQDKNFNELPIAADLLAHGKDSIPFLISKLDDETELDRRIINYWYKVYVGDIALVILSDFFTGADGLTSTIQGFSWDDFLERGSDKDSTGEAVLRNYIEKYGRKNIKARWQKMWDDNKENIYWDEKERCFKVENFQK